MDVIAVFGGGGALGAFDCGVWSVLAPVLRLRGARLVAVGGVSIGTLNAACVARGGSDLRGGPARLEALWCEQLATPSRPFDPVPHAAAPCWNGLLTGLLFGNAALYRPDPWHGNRLAGRDRRACPLMDRAGLWRCIAANLDGLGTADAHTPLLCAAAVDVVDRSLRLFDNARAPLTAAQLAASSALPLLFDPVELDGRLFWDGDVTRESVLPRMLDRVRDAGRLGGDPRAGVEVEDDGRRDRAAETRPTLLVTIDHNARHAPNAPRAGVEFAHRALELPLHGKYALPADTLAGVTHRLAIEREPAGHETTAGFFDYSPSRIDALIEQGRRCAERLCERDWPRLDRVAAQGAGPRRPPPASRVRPGAVLH